MIMNRNILKPVITLFAMCFILVGCVGEKNSDGGKHKLLKSIVIEEGVYINEIKFEYDSQSRITKCIESPFTTTLTYNSAGDLIKLVSERAGGSTTTYTFTKNENKIIATSESLDDAYTFTIELNAEELPVKISGDGNSAFEYQNGNVTKMTFYNSPSVGYGYYTFTYNDKKSPWLYCKTPKWFLVTAFDLFGFPFMGLKNNANTIEGNFIEGWLSEHFVYTYDNDDYPIKTTVTGTEGYGKLSRTYDYNISYEYITK
jgi:hypothetical protein